MPLKTIVKEPLFQFLGLGFLLYSAVQGLAPEQLERTSENQIEVTKPALINYMQFRAKSFTPGNAEEHFEALDEQSKETLHADYVRDQVLYNEALSLGLDGNDEVIKRRLILKMEYVSAGFLQDMPEVKEEDLIAYFKENQETYRVPASMSFTHIFFSGEKNGFDAAKQMATHLLPQLNSQQVSFSDAAKYGDRFLYNRSYQDRPYTLVSNHFGGNFAESAFDNTTSENWQGPFISEHGAHLLYINDSKPSRIPQLEEVATAVLWDIRRSNKEHNKKINYEKMLSNYNIITREDVL
ncbi:peptidylprolyl isomerase [Flexibacterium corallicola]|uniref:peptidylprolyl isomerase n=1 Tax=Flexibacterium corallicola TaxID=3037259 RepID=UPI00286F54E1|nr:peptidylprolyl isomerase [Pseudovibrio sp. M1P-2-3]